MLLVGEMVGRKDVLRAVVMADLLAEKMAELKVVMMVG